MSEFVRELKLAISGYNIEVHSLHFNWCKVKKQYIQMKSITWNQSLHHFFLVWGSPHEICTNVWKGHLFWYIGRTNLQYNISRWNLLPETKVFTMSSLFEEVYMKFAQTCENDTYFGMLGEHSTHKHHCPPLAWLMKILNLPPRSSLSKSGGGRGLFHKGHE